VFYIQFFANINSDELSKDVNLTSVNKAELAQPLCTAIQIALVNLLRSWGVSPATVVGHSSGEIAGAYACGAITASEAIIAAYYRGFIIKQQSKAGGMAAVGLGRKQVNIFLVSDVVIACENSPSSVTLSGDQEALNYVCSRVKKELPETFVQYLQVEVAYHSRESHRECEYYF
jgi:acyl transferase domain-containing protein